MTNTSKKTSFTKGDAAEIYDSIKKEKLHYGEVVSVSKTNTHLWFRYQVGERRYQDLKFLLSEKDNSWICDHKDYYCLRHIEEA